MAAGGRSDERGRGREEGGNLLRGPCRRRRRRRPSRPTRKAAAGCLARPMGEGREEGERGSGRRGLSFAHKKDLRCGVGPHAYLAPVLSPSFPVPLSLSLSLVARPNWRRRWKVRRKRNDIHPRVHRACLTHNTYNDSQQGRVPILSPSLCSARPLEM